VVGWGGKKGNELWEETEKGRKERKVFKREDER